MSDGGFGSAVVRGTADSLLALHIHASSKMSKNQFRNNALMPIVPMAFGERAKDAPPGVSKN
jgi:hypothetical protein